jgi:DNA transformation protein
MKNRPEYLEFVLEWLSPLGGITSRAMFGGHCLYCDGTVFALIADNVLYLKANGASRPRFEALRLQPFRPFEDRPQTMQYYPPPPEFFEDRDVMREWASLAIAAGRQAKKPSRKKR